jgi:hypothetical protein
MANKLGRRIGWILVAGHLSLAMAVFGHFGPTRALADDPDTSPKSSSLRLVPEQVTLWGAGATQRFLVLARDPHGLEREVTSEATLSISNPEVATLGQNGDVISVSNGKATFQATLHGRTARATVSTRESQKIAPLSFVTDVTRILTKRGCNGSNCHGGVKGRGGFRLSSNAMHPKEDYDWIVRGGGYQVLTNESRGPRIPRINLEVPESSLLLQKPTMGQAHGGGLRFQKDSSDYRTILSWIQAGAPYDQPRTPDSFIQRLEVFPEEGVLLEDDSYQMLVTAYFSDGRREDLTEQVRYESLDGEVLQVGPSGQVRGRRVGEAVVLVRAAGKVGNARFGVIREPVADFPQVARNNFIDEEIFDKLERFHLVPSRLSGDAEFLRRVCLDVTGTLPPPQRVREFLANPDPEKREKVVEVLLDSPEYIDYWTFRWSDLFRIRLSAYDYWEWVRQSVASNKPYDVVAQERIAAQGIKGPAKHFIRAGANVERVVAEQFRVFFGRRMDCAQCHNHPYDLWTQNQFWGLAAFFGRATNIGSGSNLVVYDDPVGHEQDYGEMGQTSLVFKQVTHPRRRTRVEPAFLDGTVLGPSSRADQRLELARWMTDHPDFARATVNRYWGHFFGRGLVEPVDDVRLGNPATHPSLLQRLAEDFREHGYDLKHLIRRIVLSRTYQLSSRTNPGNRDDSINYSHALPRPLEAEVLLDAISTATGIPEDFVPPGGEIYAYETAPPGTRAINLKFPSSYRSRFLDIYGRPQRDSVGERDNKANLSQALHILVGSTYSRKLGGPGGLLEALLKSRASDREAIDELYLAALSRFPSEEERSRLAALVRSHPQRGEALEDLLWALISSREFAENH